MWRIADSDGIVQPNVSFVHQRTHTPDPKGTLNAPLADGSFEFKKQPLVKRRARRQRGS
jgi:hypothetical protein